MTDLSQLTITDVRAVDVRNVPFSEGLIPPWNPTLRITSRDYVVIRVDSNQGFYCPSLPIHPTKGLLTRDGHRKEGAHG